MSDVYQEGYDAYRRELPLEDNPYAAEQRDRWIEGWEDAKIDMDLGKELDRRKTCSERKE